MSMDKARRETDKKLHRTEKQISDIYRSNRALYDVTQEYKEYSLMVQQRLAPSYDAYVKESDPDKKEKLKKAYMKELRAVTVDSKRYNNLVKKIAKIMAQVNQDALDVVNGQMVSTYTINYNQVAVDCRKAGIEVDG